MPYPVKHLKLSKGILNSASAFYFLRLKILELNGSRPVTIFTVPLKLEHIFLRIQEQQSNMSAQFSHVRALEVCFTSFSHSLCEHFVTGLYSIKTKLVKPLLCAFFWENTFEWGVIKKPLIGISLTSNLEYSIDIEVINNESSFLPIVCRSIVVSWLDNIVLVKVDRNIDGPVWVDKRVEFALVICR